MSDVSQLIRDLIGETVVLDMHAPYVYIGTLAGTDGQYLVLEEADVHDLRDSSTTRELYVLDSKRHGIGVNRARVYVERNQVVSLSKLSDVRE
jgi:small nuclear ribonucleoprotein (snRNP)-like protein